LKTIKKATIPDSEDSKQNHIIYEVETLEEISDGDSDHEIPQTS